MIPLPISVERMVSQVSVPTKYRVFIKYCVFSLTFLIFWTLPALLQCWCSACHTLTPRENRERQYLKIFEKNTIFNEHPVCIRKKIVVEDVKKVLVITRS